MFGYSDLYPVIFTDSSFVDPFILFMFHVCLPYAVLYVPCSLEMPRTLLGKS